MSMIKGKIVGVTIGGLAGYLLINKALNVICHISKQTADACKWRAYYKNAHDVENGVNCVVPPGYASCTRQIGKDKEYVIEDPKQKKDNSNGNSQDASDNALKASLSDAVIKVINELFDGHKKQEGGKESQTEASTKANDICVKDCLNCTAGDLCPYKNLKLDGVITEWDDDGNPVAGRYSWDKEKGTECHWSIKDAEDILYANFDKAPDNQEVLYHDDLFNGVETEEPEEEKENEDETLD